MDMIELPLYFLTGLVAVFHFVIHLPWPNLTELFRSLMVFVFLYPIRNYMERRWLKKRFGRKRAVKAPSPADHQAAAASVADLFTR